MNALIGEDLGFCDFNPVISIKFLLVISMLIQSLRS